MLPDCFSFSGILVDIFLPTVGVCKTEKEDGNCHYN